MHRHHNHFNYSGIEEVVEEAARSKGTKREPYEFGDDKSKYKL
jgi:hypothetical protein